MNSLDIIIVVIIGLAAFRGFHRGLIKEAVSLCAVFIALFVASHLHTIFMPHLRVYFANRGSVLALSYVITFIGTLVALWFFVRFLQGVLKVTMLTLVDKITGAAFGALEGLLISLVILLLLKAVLPGADIVRQSSMAKKAEPALVLLADFTPAPVRETLHEGGFRLPALPAAVRRPVAAPPASVHKVARHRKPAAAAKTPAAAKARRASAVRKPRRAAARKAGKTTKKTKKKTTAKAGKKAERQ